MFLWTYLVNDCTVSILPFFVIDISDGGLCSINANNLSPETANAVLQVSFWTSNVPKVIPFLNKLDNIGNPSGAAPNVPPKVFPLFLLRSNWRPLVSTYVAEYVIL